MKVLAKMNVLAGAVALAACTTGGAVTERALQVQEQLSPTALFAAHPGEKICVDFRAADNSCSSIIETTVSGRTIRGVETAALRDFETGDIGQLTLRTRAQVEGERVCGSASHISLGSTTLNPNTARLVVEATRSLISQVGGVCASYFRAGDGYVVRVRGRDGSIFPPGDSRLDFFTGTRSLRAQ